MHSFFRYNRSDTPGASASRFLGRAGSLVSAALLAACGSVSADEVPVVQDVRIEPGNPTGADDLECIAGSVTPSGGDVTLTHTWTVNGAAVGETGPVLGEINIVRGDEVSCAITPRNGDLEGDTVTSTAVSVANAAPTIELVSISPNPANTLDVLTCTAGTLADGDNDDFNVTYVWTVNGTIVGGQETLPEDRFIKGDVVRCSIAAVDSEGASNEIESPPATIANALPTLSAEILTGSVFRCAFTTPPVDPDGEQVNLTAEWLRDGTPFTDGPVSTVFANDTIPNGVHNCGNWTCRVTATDGEGEVTAEVAQDGCGPNHTFLGLTSEHFITQGGCSAGTEDQNAQFFCASFYGANCVARPGFLPHQTPTATYPKMHKVTGCTTRGNDIPATNCAGVPCKVGDWVESTNGVGNIVCQCP